MSGNRFKQLYNDKRFNQVSAQTKTDIINTIGFDVNNANDAVEESKFTQDELRQGMRYILVEEAKKKPEVKNYYVCSSSSSSVDRIFFFNNNDPLLNYYLIDSATHLISGDPGAYHHSDCCQGLSSGSGGGDRHAEAVCCAITAAAVVAVGCCYCTAMNLKDIDRSNETQGTKSLKSAGSILSGLSAAVLSGYFFLSDAFRGYQENQNGWTHEGTIAFGIVMAGLIGATVSNVTAFLAKQIECLPKPESFGLNRPSQAVLDELATARRLITENYHKQGDDSAQVREFIKAVIHAYIDEAGQPNSHHVIDIANPSQVQTHSFFSQPQPSAPSINLEENVNLKVSLLGINKT